MVHTVTFSTVLPAEVSVHHYFRRRLVQAARRGNNVATDPPCAI